jgi:HAE1 family hydrophobic/amphiphilic exporter-1
MRLMLTGSQDEQTLKQLAEDTISPLLLRIEGVSQVEVRGAGDKQVEVLIDPIRLEAYDLTLSQVKNALVQRNVQGKVGTITQNLIDYSITIDERYTDLEAIRQTVITIIDEVPIRIDDVATVTESLKTGFNEQYLDGSPIVTLSLSNASDSNAATVANLVARKP